MTVRPGVGAGATPRCRRANGWRQKRRTPQHKTSIQNKKQDIGEAMSRRSFLQRHRIRSAIVFHALQLGDMLCAVPALRALRAALPDARITLTGLPWAAQFAQRFPTYVNEFIAFPGHPLLPDQAVRHDELTAFYAGIHDQCFDLALQLHGSADVSNHIVSGFGARTMAGFSRNEPTHTDRTLLLPYLEAGAEPERLLRLSERIGAPAVGNHPEFRSFKLTQSCLTLLKARLAVKFLLHRGRFHPALARRASAFPSTGRHGGTHRHIS